MYYMLSSVTERPEEVLDARPDQPAPVVHFYCPSHGGGIGSRAICRHVRTTPPGPLVTEIAEDRWRVVCHDILNQTSHPYPDCNCLARQVP